MSEDCYYCGQIFDTKEALYNHLEVHSKPESEQKEKKVVKKKKEKTAEK